jgi:hemerythrin
MPVHNKAIQELAPEDYLLIEKEHNQLEKYLINLRDACACSTNENPADCQLCDHEKKVLCLGRLPSFLFCIIEFATKHFEHEEAIMLNRPHVSNNDPYFRAHQQAHFDIVLKLQALVDECLSLKKEGNIPEIYRYFYDNIAEMFESHDRLFDNPFIQSTQSKTLQASPK